MQEEIRVGVYICHCGGNISDTVDVERVRESASTLEGVEVAKTYEYVCSDPGQEMIAEGIEKHGLNRIVVASCSPRMHLDTFRRTVESAGLNSYFLEMANIREQSSWVHDDVEAATSKAIDLVRGAVARARQLEPLETKSIPVDQDVLVIGGGIAGTITSLELADKGYQVHLVERTPSIGGHMAQLSKTFPTLDCSQCILTPKMVDVDQHPRIDIISMAEPTAVEGSPGNYRVLIRKRPRYVDASKCTACGECEKVCPVKVPSEFEADLFPRKAIYIPFQQAVPRTYVIDEDHCLNLTKGVCRVCEKFCKGNAIDFDQKEETLELDVGAIVACTGFDQLDPREFEEYGFGLHPDIVTNLQLERLLGQGMHRPSNGGVAKRIAFLLCVGSRMMDQDRGVEHCCNIGCMAAIKQAMLVQKIVPDVEPWIFYTDIRADAKGYEEFYATAQDHDVRFVRGRVAEVVPSKEDDTVIVRAEDTLMGSKVEGAFDLVVLTLGIIPSSGTKELAKNLGIQVGSDGFLLEKHYKLNPVDSQREGVFVAGGAVSPKDVRETTLEAMSTASRVATFVGKGEIDVSPEVAHIIPERCNLCGVCVDVCPVEAVEESPHSITINPVSCVGCGICVPRCPQDAIELKNCTDEQLIAQIRAVSEGGESPKIVAFLEKEIAYGSADLAGQMRHSYPSNVEIIRVPTTGRIGLRHVLQAFAAGADGVLLLENHGGVFSEEALREHVIQMKKRLRDYGVKSLRLMSFSTTLPEYTKVTETFETF
nr:hydrogenase iron-sulfur subunit [Candidatus Bathyarchaeota archaeon]NIR18069.1 hydrogenase iron-sulfur subunit [Desulfobacterales bacterium]NIU81751.1 hydrogenase iron-sulfur subunit [Candidatus Bathyarchaeota archaeon]NIV67701.1 hydrogenase iron-sulfur subunit [Candidatus Bathyarchaeota archaeon]NIW16711.1 hydrogenase iron-sulfur subunit [Candidatus Bathyarchaeota archaeon]